jgi:hypothetical protein
MRLVLDYWNGENKRACDYPQDKKTARSKVILVN